MSNIVIKHQMLSTKSLHVFYERLLFVEPVYHMSPKISIYYREILSLTGFDVCLVNRSLIFQFSVFSLVSTLEE